MNSITRIIRYLDLNSVGLIEFVFALTPMLSGYNLGVIPMSSLMWLLLIFLVIARNRKIKKLQFKAFSIFVLYWFFHTLLISFSDKVNYIGFLMQIILFVSVYLLCPILNYNKLKGSLNWIVLVSLIGLLYQWIIISAGGEVGPLKIPGLSMDEVRIEGVSVRPSSFFMEPAAYVSFMICPLLIALIDRKYIWAIIIVLSIFLTTSTTGLIVTFIMLGALVFSQKMKLGSVIGVLLLGAGLLLVLTKSSTFEYGVNKLETTNVDDNVRLTQGIYIVSTMNDNEYLFGVPFSTPYNYCKSGRAPDVIYYGEGVYMSTFWIMILLYGIVGLILYINIYWQILRKSRIVLPLVLSLLAVMFSSGYSIGVTYIFTLIFLLVITRGNQLLTINQKQIQ